MSEKIPAPVRSQGGSQTARAKGLTGIVVHFTAEERQELAVAAALTNAPSAKEFCHQVLMATVKKILKKSTNL